MKLKIITKSIRLDEKLNLEVKKYSALEGEFMTFSNYVRRAIRFWIKKNK